MKNFGNNSRVCSQGVPKFFRAPTYKAHCAVIFAIAQLSHEFLTDFTYRNLHGFARFPGDSTALVIGLVPKMLERSPVNFNSRHSSRIRILRFFFKSKKTRLFT